MTYDWKNNDQLYLKYGPKKAVVESSGEFKSYGANRVVEVLIDLTTLTSTAAIQSDNLLFPAGSNVYIEKVEVTTEVAATAGTSFSVGLIQLDRSTIPTNYSTAFINAEVLANVDTVGKAVTYTTGTTHAGGLIGSFPASATGPYYITALAAGTFSAGKVRVRIYYHGVGVISN